MATSATMTSTAVDQDIGTTISAVHSDILRTHILTRLDGPALASAGCASSQLHALSTEQTLWRDISTSTWPSINNPRVDGLISSFPAGHRSFFSDSFPLLTYPSSQENPHRLSLSSGIISSVDIYYQNKAIFSKVQETETMTGWFRSSPFRIDMLEPKDSFPKPIVHAGVDDTCRSHVEENLTLSWIVIDPTQKRSANLSCLRPVSVRRHWLTEDMQVRYATILAGDQNVSSSEFVMCEIMVTCGGKEGGEMHVREVSMHVEDMGGRSLNGEESLIILQGACSHYINFTPRIRSPSLKKCFSISAMASSPDRKVLVPIANGTEPMEAVITIDVLRRAGADVTVASVEKQLRVDACHGVKIDADALITDCGDSVFDLISLPGGIPGASALKECGVLESMVKKQAADGRPYAAICAAPAVALGSWGLLKGLKATCYPSFMEQLRSSATAVESRVQLDGKVVTSRGPGTTMEFSIALIELLYGKEKADEVSGPLVMRSNHGDEYTIAELNPMDWTFNNCPQILVPIANGTEEMEAVMIIDVLRRAKANVVVASVEDKLEIVASRKVKLVADMLLDEAVGLSYDLVVLPGGLGGAQAFANSEKLVNLLKKQRESNRPYGAICASPALVLEPHGLLKGKKATAFPAMCNKLSDQSWVENRVVVDGNLITSRGPGTSLEFSLAIVEKFFGRKRALEIAKTMLFTHP